MTREASGEDKAEHQPAWAESGARIHPCPAPAVEAGEDLCAWASGGVWPYPTTVTAQARGCRTVDGLGMLVNQAVISIEYWTGVSHQSTHSAVASSPSLVRL